MNIKKQGGVLGVVLLLFLTASPAFALKVYTTSPWLAMIVEFIGGDYAQVSPLSSWGAGGGVHSVRRYPGSGLVFALDKKDAERFGFKKQRSELELLFERMPDTKQGRDSVFSDPSILPFIAQRVLKAFSRHAPDSYPYYQRRLAEFQSRLDSTLEVGRHLLPPKKGIDLTGATGAWVRAAMPGMVRPPAKLWEAWRRGESLEGLVAALNEAQVRGWIIVTDPWTPSRIAEKANGRAGLIALPQPKANQEIFLYLNDLYLAIYNALHLPQGAKTP